MYLHKPYKKSGDYKYRDLYFFLTYIQTAIFAYGAGEKKKV